MKLGKCDYIWFNTPQKNARRLSLARFTNRVESIDLEHQPLNNDNELLRIQNQLQLTLEKQQKRERRKKLQSMYNREMDNEYVPYDEMGTAVQCLVNRTVLDR